jgi:predicted glycosyltransferase
MIPNTNPTEPVEGTRILLYSPDSYGLGHLRRTLTLATTMREAMPEASVLIATGSACATHFETPSGVDMIKLPSATKDHRGGYVARTLPIPLESLIRLRSSLLLEIQDSFRPDLLVVDHKVLGLEGELAEVLPYARSQGTRTILGIRDIIDESEVVAREWGRPRIRKALAHDYDRVCIYGSPEVFDARTEYPVPPELAERLEFTGYVVRPESTRSFRPVPGLVPRVLVTVGGGEDGADRVETYLEAIETSSPDWESVIVLGPLVDRARARRIKRRARLLDGVEVHLFYEDKPRLHASSSAVVAKAGYNTVTEILRSRVPAVLLPRCFPRKEQLIRARRLEDLGLAECLPAPTPESLADAVATAIRRGRVQKDLPPLDGAQRLCKIAEDLIGHERRPIEEAVSR